MDNANAAAGEQGFVAEVEQEGGRVLTTLKTDAENVVDKIFGPGTSAKGETLGAEIISGANDVASVAIAALKAFGAGHVNLTQLSLTAELSDAKTKAEATIVALARHIAGL